MSLNGIEYIRLETALEIESHKVTKSQSQRARNWTSSSCMWSLCGFTGWLNTQRKWRRRRRITTTRNIKNNKIKNENNNKYQIHCDIKHNVDDSTSSSFRTAKTRYNKNKTTTFGSHFVYTACSLQQFFLKQCGFLCRTCNSTWFTLCGSNNNSRQL